MADVLLDGLIASKYAANVRRWYLTRGCLSSVLSLVFEYVCTTDGQVEGELCSVTGDSPCIIDNYTPAPVVPDFGSAAPVGGLLSPASLAVPAPLF